MMANRPNEPTLKEWQKKWVRRATIALFLMCLMQVLYLHPMLSLLGAFIGEQTQWFLPRWVQRVMELANPQYYTPWLTLLLMAWHTRFYTKFLDRMLSIGQKAFSATDTIMSLAIRLKERWDYHTRTHRAYFNQKRLDKVFAQGQAEGKVEGKVEERQAWHDWLQRRNDAEASGQPFHEPPPGSNTP